MITAFHIALCLGIPVLASVSFYSWSRRKLSTNPMISISQKALQVFLLSRLIFHSAFGILIVTFLFAIIHYGMSGEETRLVIATSPTYANFAITILSSWSNVILPVLFASIFVSLFALGTIGKNALRLMPQEGKPGAEFSGFRFTFLLMAMSLILPPLVFGSLLLL
jgi:hypothetical protein